MNRSITHRLGRAGLALVLAIGTLVPFVAAPALADTLNATLVNEVDTSVAPWVPASTTRDLGGVAYIGPHLLLADMNALATQQSWDYVISPPTPTPTAKPIFGTGLEEPTGLDYDAAHDRLFVSSDALNDNRIEIINNFTTAPTRLTPVNVEAVSGDTEDPAFDPATNTLYFLDGQTEFIRKMAINPDTGVGTLDTTFFIDLTVLSPETDGDWEAMTWNADRGTLVVAPHNGSQQLYEIPPVAGQPQQANNIINAAGISTNLLEINGLAMGPTTGGGGASYFIVDRESNGLYEITTNALGQLAPIAYNSVVSVPFQTMVPVNLVATDANNDTLTYVIDTPPAVGVLGGSGAARTYTPPNAFSGQVTFTFHANDGTDDSNVAMVTLNVQAQNTAPVLTAIPTPIAVNELDNVTFQAAATDTVGDALTFSILNAPAGATMTPTGLFTWRPTEAQGPGSYNITVQVTDSGGLFDTQVVTINVAEVGGTPPPTNYGPPSEDEMLFYRTDGLFKYYDMTPTAGLNGPILQGSGYSQGWNTITSVDMDGDGQDEMFFYREIGTFAYYNINTNATIGAPIRAGGGYSVGWDAITAVDLDGDGQDEMFFYRDDGTFRYYNLQPNGSLGTLIKTGTGYSLGWDAITAVDLDGDGQDELFFYRDDGNFRYYNVQPNGSLGGLIRGGTGYSLGWDSITAVDLDGDEFDEIFFYRADGNFRYYNIQPNASLGGLIRGGTGYTQNWTVITAVNLNGN